MDQLTPMQDEGLENQAQQSPNLRFGAGGAPLHSVVEESTEEVPPPQRFRVLEDKAVAANGHRFTMRAGKEIDSANYDIPLLRRFGVKLETIAP